MAIKISELPATQVEAIDDRGLVIDFKSGDTDAYGEIYRRYFAYARGVSLRILRNPEDADEAAQETMVRVLRALPRFNGRFELRAWIARIATNVSLDMVRSTTRRTRNLGYLQCLDLVSTEDQYDHTGEDPSETVERIVEAHQVQVLLSELPANHRDALVLREIEGRSHQEIADELGMTPSQVKALIHRAKGSFRRLWIGREGTGGVAGVLIFLVPQRFAGGLRRIAEQAANASRVTASASPTMSAAASSPALLAAASETGQKVVAAAVTLLVAGSLTVGGIEFTRHRTQASPAPLPAAVVAAPPVTSPKAAVKRPVKPRHTKLHPARAKIVAVGPAPSSSPTSSPTESPSPSPSGGPSEVPPPTAFTTSGSSDFTTTVRCGCGAAPTSVDEVHGKQQGVTSFAEEIVGAALADGTGESAWRMDLKQSSSDGVSHEMVFDLWTPAGPERFIASGTFVSRAQTAWGGWTYVFEGSYAFQAGPSDGLALVPANGTYRMAVTVSVAPGKVVSTDLALRQNPTPSPEPTPSPDPTPSPEPA